MGKISASLDCLEAAMIKHVATQLHFAKTQASMESKLDVILLKLNTMVPNQPSPSSSSAKSPLPTKIMSPPLPMAPPLLPANDKPHASSSNPRPTKSPSTNSSIDSATITTPMAQHNT